MSATEKDSADQEHCPRCIDGLLYRITETENSTGEKCLSCQYHESRVKQGFEVKAPGEPITKVEVEA